MDFTDRAQVLIEAIPYIRSFYGKTFVIKYGGSAMLNAELKRAVILDLILLKYLGLNPVVVHGGGPEISALLKQVGKETIFAQGQRITDAETMTLVNMVLAGKINKEIVALFNQLGGKAIGLSGQDDSLLVAKKKILPGEKIDLGFVGEVETIHASLIYTLLDKSYIPVIAPVGVGRDGHFYNINADTVAGELAGALKAEKLILLTDTEGILADPTDPGSLISVLTTNEAQYLIETGRIDGGMIPKVEACTSALRQGVKRTHIIDGRRLHSLLLEVLTDQGIGTMVVEEKEDK
ncbi:MAG: acetylglutamate kinase [Firmicutes bacterium]|nr:acetylglutamate kinase [Bacillota bacterium]